MPNIIAGRFIEQAEAEAAMARLEKARFPRDAMASFFVNAPGQHDRFPIGGDEDESPGTEHAAAEAISSAVGGGIGVAVGLVTLPVLGPIAPLAGAAVGAYVGSFIGALDSMQANDTPNASTAVAPQEPRKSGMMVAVLASATAGREQAISVLRSCGASDVEQAQGNIRGRAWADFDPLTPVAVVDRCMIGSGRNAATAPSPTSNCGAVRQYRRRQGFTLERYAINAIPERFTLVARAVGLNVQTEAKTQFN